MPVSKADAEQFFSTYADALSSRNVARIAEHWGTPSLVLSDAGAIAVASTDEVEKFFASSMDQYEGVATAKAKITTTTQLSREILACEVEWSHEDASGEAVGSETGHYILKRGPTACAYISTHRSLHRA